MYENIYNIEYVQGNDSLDYLNDIRNYFVLDADTIYMISNNQLNAMYEQVKSSEANSIPYYVFKRRMCSNKENLPKIKQAWCLFCDKADKSVIEYFESHTIDENIEHYCEIIGRDTVLRENDLTVVYCFDKHSYNCFFNYGEPGITKVTKIVSEKYLPRVPISEAYDIY